jgi:hypothetical protein
MKRLISILIMTILSWSAYALEPSAKNFLAHLTGDEEVPLRETGARGQAIFQLSESDSLLTFKLIVANIDNVVAAHIHMGLPGSNGPVVAFLYGSTPPGGGRIQGVIGDDVISAADLVGPLAGQALSVLVEAMQTGGAYVNVHTNDGVDPPNTGPGDFPGGEIRGQIRIAGPE